MSELTEDEAVAALRDAMRLEAEYPQLIQPNETTHTMARALLGRVMWLLDWAKDSDGYCAECGGYLARSEDAHVRNCSVALWTRAAKRVGLC